jgi:hypothetical protein
MNKAERPMVEMTTIATIFFQQTEKNTIEGKQTEDRQITVRQLGERL